MTPWPIGHSIDEQNILKIEIIRTFFIRLIMLQLASVAIVSQWKKQGDSQWELSQLKSSSISRKIIIIISSWLDVSIKWQNKVAYYSNVYTAMLQNLLAGVVPMEEQWLEDPTVEHPQYLLRIRLVVPGMWVKSTYPTAIASLTKW